MATRKSRPKSGGDEPDTLTSTKVVKVKWVRPASLIKRLLAVRSELHPYYMKDDAPSSNVQALDQVISLLKGAEDGKCKRTRRTA